MRSHRRLAWATTVVALVVAMSACSTGDEPGGQTGSPQAVGTDISAEAQAALDAAYEGVGSDLSDLEPSAPPSDINFFAVSCGESLETCAAPAAAMVEAAEAAGWNGNIVDGKLTPEGFATAIRQAIAGGADVISAVGLSCSSAAAAWAEAKAAGVVIVGGGGIDDCDPQIWDSERLWLADPPVPSQFHAMGMVQAEYIFGKTNGDAKAIVVQMASQPWGQLVTDAFTAEMDTLGGEVLEVVNISDPEMADGTFTQKIVSALLANPGVTGLAVPTDAYFVNGLAAAIDQAGFAEQVVAVGGFGSAGALDMIRDGQPGITATVGVAQIWQAWGSIDTAIRVFNEQDVAFIGESVQAVDKDHNLPESGPYSGSIDWKSKFLEAWGAE